MKIQYMSDLHFEFHKDMGKGFINSLDPEGIDVLILAGDIANASILPEVMRRFCSKYSEIIYVPGNHEYWKVGLNEFKLVIKELQKITNLTVLNTDVANVSGNRFVGCTMWFPFEVKNDFFTSSMNDFSFIKGFRNWVYKENRRQVDFLNKNVKEGDIVITHYLPSRKCIHPFWKGSNINRFFVCEMDRLIQAKKPKYWVFGHTHNTIDLKIEETRLLCNPFGYAGKDLNQNFNNKAVFEI